LGPYYWTGGSGDPGCYGEDGDYFAAGYGGYGGYADWEFDNIQSGDRLGENTSTQLAVYVTWDANAPVPGGGQWASNAWYCVYNGTYYPGSPLTNLLEVVQVDQTGSPPTDQSPEQDDHPWRRLGVYNVTSGTITVVVSTQDPETQAYSNGQVQADAAMVRPLWPEVSIRTDWNGDGSFDEKDDWLKSWSGAEAPQSSSSERMQVHLHAAIDHLFENIEDWTPQLNVVQGEDAVAFYSAAEGGTAIPVVDGILQYSFPLSSGGVYDGDLYTELNLDEAGSDVELEFHMLDSYCAADVKDANKASTNPVVKVEFVPSGQLNLTNNPDKNYYGTLQVGQNPDGNNKDTIRGALKEPAFMGGDMFFPDAIIDAPDKGRNIVRVRATVNGLAEGASVYFRAFDVDDPSTDPTIDTNDKKGPTGNDNRGQLAKSLHTPAASKRPTQGGYQGRLRAVNAGQGGEELGKWGDEGAVVEAKVKKITVNNQEVLVAEVDLLTSFAPGDNFRVLACDAARTGALKNAGVNPEKPPCIPTKSDQPYLTPQLSVWRYLHIEDDCINSGQDSADMRKLMQAGTTNRQSNRFADAYLEPEYASINNANINKNKPQPRNPRLNVNANSSINAQQEGEINAARDSSNLEKNTFWVVYVTDVYLTPTDGLWGITSNKFTQTPYDASVIFSNDMIRALTPEAGKVAIGKVAVHEVGHQILLALKPGGADNSGHRGTGCKNVNNRAVGDVADYYRASEDKKRGPQWVKTVNIMSPDGQLVPMNNDAAALPNEPGATAGPFDMFYFYSLDIAAMRRRVASPGKKP